MEIRYRLRRKATEKIFYTDKALMLEQKGVIALLRSWFPDEVIFTAADLAEYTYEDAETISNYLRGLEENQYISQVI